MITLQMVRAYVVTRHGMFRCKALKLLQQLAKDKSVPFHGVGYRTYGQAQHNFINDFKTVHTHILIDLVLTQDEASLLQQRLKEPVLELPKQEFNALLLAQALKIANETNFIAMVVDEKSKELLNFLIRLGYVDLVVSRKDVSAFAIKNMELLRQLTTELPENPP